MINTVILLLSIVLCVESLLIVGAYVMTMRYKAAALRSAHLVGVLDRDKKSAHQRIAALRDDVERLRLEKASLEQEVALLRAPKGQAGNSRQEFQALVMLLTLILLGVVAVMVQISQGCAL